MTQDAGGMLVVPHDELEFGGQEELYVVIEGRARFTCDGEDVEIGAGEVVAVAARVRRSAVALASPTTLLMVSGGSVPPNL
jgi:mannose-6-phosphate isomerase-like protein (cupin superfamily)